MNKNMFKRFSFIFMVTLLLSSVYSFGQSDTLPYSKYPARVHYFYKGSDWVRMQLYADSAKFTTSDKFVWNQIYRLRFTDGTSFSSATHSQAISTITGLQDSLTNRYRRSDTAYVLLSLTRASHDYQPKGTYVTSVSGTAPVVSSGGVTPAISIDTTKVMLFNDTLADGKIATNHDLTLSEATARIWYSLAGAYASTSTFTLTGTQAEADKMYSSLIRWESTAGAIRYGHITNATESAGTITATVRGTVNMAASDKNYYYAPNLKAREFQRRITIPGEQIADASNPQGMWFQGNTDSLQVFDVSAWVLTAAVGAGAACAFNIYHGATNIFSSAVDLTTNASSLNNQPNTVTIPPSVNMTLRITSSAGATNKASNFQAVYYAVPTRIFWGK